VKVHHSIFVDLEISEQLFSECGVPLKHEGRFGSYDITELDPRWPCVSAAISRYQAVADAISGFSVAGCNLGDRVWTEFTDEERNRAPFLTIWACHHGYPQPETMKMDAPSGPDKLVYLRRTYDFSGGCEKCWAGRKQIAPFRIKKSPVWGRRLIFQMNWEPDEFFVKPDVYEAVFGPFGIGFRPVVMHKTGDELDSVVQLSIEAVAEVRVDGISYTVCARCGRKDYRRSCRGFPPVPMHAGASMFKSAQCFNGSKRVYVSNDLYQKIVYAKLKGAEFDPCLENPA
jgi:hypothetical protein